MPRPIRRWSAGCFMHVMNRGVRRLPLFSEPKDYEVFISYMDEMQEKYACEILAWCLMTNHFHILMKTGDIPVGDIMRFLQMHYAQYYNRRYDCTGHLFETRYTSKFVDSDNYLLTASRYIHLNPVKAHLAGRPQDYPYSSYSDYMPIEMQANRHFAGIASNGQILSYFGKNTPEAEYKKFVESGIEEGKGAASRNHQPGPRLLTAREYAAQIAGSQSPAAEAHRPIPAGEVLARRVKGEKGSDPYTAIGGQMSASEGQGSDPYQKRDAECERILRRWESMGF